MTLPLLSRRALLMLVPAAGAAAALAGCDRPVSRPIFGDLRFTVADMDGRRVARVKIQRVKQPIATTKTPAASDAVR